MSGLCICGHEDSDHYAIDPRCGIPECGCREFEFDEESAPDSQHDDEPQELPGCPEGDDCPHCSGQYS
jgi:hypothetical protein